MTTSVTEQLTDLLGAPVPADYIALIENYPKSLRSANRALDNSESEGTVADVELLQSLKCVFALNIEARSDVLTEPDGTEILWPEQFLIIGESGEGDYFCIDVENEVEGVVRYDHQAVEFEIIADSLNEYVETLEDSFLSIEDSSH